MSNLAHDYDDAIEVMAAQRREIEALRGALREVMAEHTDAAELLVAANRLLQRWKNRSSVKRANELWTATTIHLDRCKGKTTEGGNQEKAND